MTRGIILVPAIEQLRTQINFLESRIELLDEQEEHSVNASGQYQVMVDSLDSLLELLRNVKEELNRMLSPRYIKKQFAKPGSKNRTRSYRNWFSIATPI